MATAIKAIPTLRGSVARNFRQKAEAVETRYQGNWNHEQHPFCKMANDILSRAVMAQ